MGSGKRHVAQTISHTPPARLPLLLLSALRTIRWILAAWNESLKPRPA